MRWSVNIKSQVTFNFYHLNKKNEIEGIRYTYNINEK